MLRATLWAVLLWIVGLLTIVPYGIYHLTFHVEREHLAFNLTLVLFWIFGYWGVAGPILGAIKVRAAFRALEHAHAEGRLREMLQSTEVQDAAVDAIARENRIPRFLAARVLRMLTRRLAEHGVSEGSQRDDGLTTVKREARGP